MTSLDSTINFLDILDRAAASLRTKELRPTAKEVVNALLQAEKTAKQQRLVYPLEALFGQWRLCFTAPKNAHLKSGVALGKGFYVPQIAPAQIAFSPSQNLGEAGIANSLQFASLQLKLTGPARYVGKKNLLMFDFTQVEILLFNRAIYSGGFRGGKLKDADFYKKSVAKAPFFAFFRVTEDLIAARGRGGGLALWVKESIW
ncbi:hypothetical protein [Synechocystis sp. PCC 7509]|uniref:hypothetical protein n=1 Tax=Synechocystis sp. PCC 7509 TaxID=927677 RepID=UPI0002AC0FBA|nr:hypothetical protein [Synechocystis sp. PCC 7509]